MNKIITFFLLLLAPALLRAQQDPRLAHAYRTEKNGWIYVHLQGSPEQIGFQHGYLLAPEIDNTLHLMAYMLQKKTGKLWSFYREAAKRMFWNKVDPEYRQEITGITDGLKARGFHYDVYDLTALNGWMELADYYVPYLADRGGRDSLKNQAPGNCSAFIATGSYTRDGKIVMGHNAWVNYLVGERWNIIADIVPTHGHRIFMDTYPGFIHSGDDFAENSAGILITETTITQFNGFDPKGIPEFDRARKAEQYASSIDDFIRIMLGGNNGGYANDWLVGDTKTNEIARLELGLKDHRVWRTRDGIYVGSNFPSDPKLMRQETDFNPKDSSSSPIARECRWNVLAQQNKGRIDARTGMQMEADTYDQISHTRVLNRCVIAGAVDTDPHGAPEWGWPPYYPGGTVQAKVTTSDLAKKMEFWAHMGNPSGKNFLAGPFLLAHPQFKWMSPYLRDMMAYPWTLFSVQK